MSSWNTQIAKTIYALHTHVADVKRGPTRGKKSVRLAHEGIVNETKPGLFKVLLYAGITLGAIAIAYGVLSAASAATSGPSANLALAVIAVIDLIPIFVALGALIYVVYVSIRD